VLTLAKASVQPEEASTCCLREVYYGSIEFTYDGKEKAEFIEWTEKNINDEITVYLQRHLNRKSITPSEVKGVVALCHCHAAATAAPPPSCRRRHDVVLPPPPQPPRCCHRAATVALPPPPRRRQAAADIHFRAAATAAATALLPPPPPRHR
jgi:hypothetical protein